MDKMEFTSALEIWKSGSFLLEMKPRVEFASLFVSCPRNLIEDTEPVGLIRLEEQTLELTIDPQKYSSGLHI
jgi:hypothetical protein